MPRRKRLPPSTVAPAIATTSRETLLAEKADYERQIAQAQQEMQTWVQRGMLASGALQAVEALLAKLEEKPNA